MTMDKRKRGKTPLLSIGSRVLVMEPRFEYHETIGRIVDVNLTTGTPIYYVRIVPPEMPTVHNIATMHVLPR